MGGLFVADYALNVAHQLGVVLVSAPGTVLSDHEACLDVKAAVIRNAFVPFLLFSGVLLVRELDIRRVGKRLQEMF